MITIFDYAKWIALIGMLSALYAFGYTTGRDSVQLAWDKEKAEIATATVDHSIDNSNKINNLERLKNENQKIIDALKHDLDTIRVRVPHCPVQSSKPSSSTGVPNGTSATREQPDTTQASFDDFIGELGQNAVDMDEVVESCRVLRDWAAGLSKLP